MKPKIATEEPFVRVRCQFLGGKCDQKCNSESNMERDAFCIRQRVIHRDLVREDLCRRRNHRYTIHHLVCVCMRFFLLSVASYFNRNARLQSAPL